MVRQYDVVVLGAGNAGLSAAHATHAAGKSVAIVEYRGVGGTCPLRGCVPKKVLVAAAETLDTIAHADTHAIAVTRPKLDWAQLIAREQSFTEGKSETLEKSLQQRGIDLYQGRAHFVGNRRIQVDSTMLEAAKVVIATGSKPRPLSVAGAEYLITSDDLLNLKALPEQLVFIGGGVISLEFAHVLARAGAKVTILEVGSCLLPMMDADAVENLRAATENLGIEIITQVEVEAIVLEGSAFKVRFKHQGKTHTRLAEKVVNSAGRIPDVEDLDLAAASIEHKGPNIVHTEYLRSTSNPDVYIAGDTVPDSAQLSPLATYEGKLVGESIIQGDVRTPEYLAVPSVVFTVPALAAVGLTEAEAKEEFNCEIQQNDMRAWFSFSLYGSEIAYSKVIIEAESRRILGAHLVGKRAEELIHLFALAMKFQVSADDLAAMVYAFPTFSSDIASMV